jgi:hypothetical protein
LRDSAPAGLANGGIEAAEVPGIPGGVALALHLDVGFDGGDDVLPKPVAGGEPLIQEPPVREVANTSRDDDYGPGDFKVGVGFRFSH